MGNLQDDIIRYKRGELSPKEMHSLEKKALSDPFLAEALEGLENISPENCLSDVEELNRKILKEKKAFLFTPLRIAAAVILVSATIFLFYQLMPKHESLALKTEKQNVQTPAPKTEPPKPEEKKELKENDAPAKSAQGEGSKFKHHLAKAESPKIKHEQLDVKTDQVASESAKPKIETQPIIAEQKELAGPDDKVEDAKVEVQNSAPMAQVMQPAKELQQEDLKAESSAIGRAKKAKYKSEALSGAGLPGKVSAAPKSITGKVVSAEDKAPIPGVNIVIDGTTTGTVTDADGKYTLQTSGENQRLVFSFIGLQSQEVNIEGKNKVDVELKNDATQLSEVVVTGMGIAKDEDAEPVIHFADPVGGRKAFNKYLESKVRYPEEALKNNIKGKVKVEFAVLVDGTLDQYKVVKSLGYGCDEEVIRLIKEGPKWTPTTENGRPVESTVLVGLKFDPAKAGR